MDPQAPSTLTPEELNKRMAIPAVPRDGHMITIVSMAVFVLLSLAAVAFLYYQNQQLKTMLASYQAQATPLATLSPTPEATSSAIFTASPSGTPRACTQEAKLCPNGSYVGRTGPNCEFAPCP